MEVVELAETIAGAVEVVPETDTVDQEVTVVTVDVINPGLGVTPETGRTTGGGTGATPGTGVGPRAGAGLAN